MGQIEPKQQDCQIIDEGAQAIGCFNLLQVSGAKNAIASNSDGNYGFSFNASLGNSLYSGNTLQHSALQTLACIKI